MHQSVSHRGAAVLTDSGIGMAAQTQAALPQRDGLASEDDGVRPARGRGTDGGGNG